MFATIKFLRLQYDVKRIDIESEFVVMSDVEAVSWKYKTKCSIETPGLFDIDQEVKSEKFCQNTENLIIIARMKILKMVDLKNERIPKRLCRNYGMHG